MTGEDYAYGPKTRKSGIAKEFKKESAGPDGHALSPSWNRPTIFFRVFLLRANLGMNIPVRRVEHTTTDRLGRRRNVNSGPAVSLCCLYPFSLSLSPTVGIFTIIVAGHRPGTLLTFLFLPHTGGRDVCRCWQCGVVIAL